MRKRRKKDRIVYLITNLINGKIYVGQDSYNRPNYFGSGIKIKNSIKKHGIHNFKKDILFQCETAEELDETETYWIAKLEATNKEIGYNIQKKSRQWIGTHKEESKLKMKIARTLYHKNNPGKHHSKETIEKIKKSNLGIKHNCPNMLGRKHSNETILKLSNINKIPICQYTLDNIFIREWDSVDTAGKELNLDGASIGKCCRGKYKQSSGFIWKYKQENNKKQRSRKSAKSKIVLQYKDGVLINEYASISEAYEKTNIACSSLSVACNNEKSLKGFIWKFKKQN